MRATLVCLLMAVAVPARAQSFEVAGLFGYTTGAELDTVTRGVDELSINGALTWGVSATYFLTDRLGFEGLFTQQPTDARITSAGVTATVLDLNISHVLGNVVYQLAPRNAPLQPFVFGGLGASILTADDYDGESKFAWTVGGGLKWLPSSLLGARVHVRYKGTRLNDGGSAICDPFGFCQDSLPQFEIAGGVIVRF